MALYLFKTVGCITQRAPKKTGKRPFFLRRLKESITGGLYLLVI